MFGDEDRHVAQPIADVLAKLHAGKLAAATKFAHIALGHSEETSDLRRRQKMFLVDDVLRLRIRRSSQEMP